MTNELELPDRHFPSLLNIIGATSKSEGKEEILLLEAYLYDAPLPDEGSSAAVEHETIRNFDCSHFIGVKVGTNIHSTLYGIVADVCQRNMARVSSPFIIEIKRMPTLTSIQISCLLEPIP